MRKLLFLLTCLVFLPGGRVWALDPVAPRSERATGVVYVETPNQEDEIILVDERGLLKDQKISSLKDVKVRVGDYLVKVKIKPEYTYEQALTVRPTERHDIIVPGFGNLRVNGTCKKVEIFKDKKKIAKIKCGKIRTLPNGNYDLKIELDKKNTLDQTVSVFTNTLREVDIVK
jgi:hypothetical protein